MTDRELLQQALAELAHCRVFVTTREKIKHPEGTELYDKVLEALRARLAQPEPEQDGECQHCDGVGCVACDARCLPQREWQGLTYKDRCELWNIASKFSPESVIMHDFAKDIEALLKAKNAPNL